MKARAHVLPRHVGRTIFQVAWALHFLRAMNATPLLSPAHTLKAQLLAAINAIPTAPCTHVLLTPVRTEPAAVVAAGGAGDQPVGPARLPVPRLA